MRTPNLWILLAWSLIAIVIAPWVAAQEPALPSTLRNVAGIAAQGVAPSFANITHQSSNSVSMIDTGTNVVVPTVPMGTHRSAKCRSLYVVNAISNEAQVSRTSTKEGGA